MNADDEGNSLPTIVRLLQLKSLVHLEEAEFDDLWQHTEETLGEDLVVAQEVTLFPAQTAERALELDPATRFLVALAIVRRPTGTSWRSVVVLPSAGDRCARFAEGGAPSPAVTFRLEDYRVSGSSRLGGAGDDVDLPSDVAERPRSTLPAAVGGS